MAPVNNLLPLGQGPRVVVYHQTHHHQGKPVSALPLITYQTGVTHVIVAAIHLNDGPYLTINDDPPTAEKFNPLWSEVSWLQASGVKVLGMLGGAAKGSYARLDSDQAQFETYYAPLAALIRARSLSGLDLDIEEEMSLPGVIRLIDRLRTDFGSSFLITMAPVATALVPGQPHLSGFDYKQLEQARGSSIAWYNTQFYCGWGDMSTTQHYDIIMGMGWLPPNKVVVGLVSNPANGPGFVDFNRLEDVLRVLRAKYPSFGGVMAWEYFNSLPGDLAAPWEWAANMARTLRSAQPPPGRYDGGRGIEMPGVNAGAGQLPLAPNPFPAEHVKTLKDLGFTDQQAVAALNMTGGNVEYAAGLLFQD